MNDTSNLPNLKISIPPLLDELLARTAIEIAALLPLPDHTPGIHYRRVAVREFGNAVTEHLIYVSEHGYFQGFFTYFPEHIAYPERYPYPRPKDYQENAGNFNVWVHRDYRRHGVGTALLTAASERWKIDFSAQDYTWMGAALVKHFLAKSCLDEI